MTAKMDRMKAQLDKLRDQIFRAEEIEAEKRGKKLIGKCYRYKNSYSCPETDADYWWLYIKIIGVEGNYVHAFSFEIDKNGHVEVTPDQLRPSMPFFNKDSGYNPISEVFFDCELNKVRDYITGHIDATLRGGK